MLNQAWHFKRPVLAQSYIKTLFTGVMLSTTVQAQSGTGLSSFLLRDVATEAQANGYVVAYIDLSDASVPVSLACVQGVRLLLKSESLGRQSWRFLRNLFGGATSSIDKEWQADGPALLGDSYYQEHVEKHASVFEDLLSEISKESDRLLFIIDHAHEFARDKVAVRMAQALRNAINANRNNIWPLYGSANMQRWHSVFQDPNAPLYSEGASVHGLPALGKPFVRQFCAQLQIHTPDLDVDEVARCFVRAGCRPKLLSEVLRLWSADDRYSLEEHCQEVLKRMDAVHGVR